MIKNFEILLFRYCSKDDLSDTLYSDGFAWSRPYEYKFVLDKIRDLTNTPNPKIHNTSWGFQGVHVIFKNELDKFSNEVLHTDIIPSTLPKTDIYNITHNKTEYKEMFDFVINISTLEEVDFNHSVIFYNLLYQVKVGGYLICTFDIPGLNLTLMEKLFESKIVDVENKLSGLNSNYSNPQCKNLNCGFLVVKKLS